MINEYLYIDSIYRSVRHKKNVGNCIRVETCGTRHFETNVVEKIYIDAETIFIVVI